MFSVCPSQAPVRSVSRIKRIELKEVCYLGKTKLWECVRESSGYRSGNRSYGKKLEIKMFNAPEIVKNHLLAALSESARQRIFPKLKRVELSLGEVIYESGQTIEYVYFPVDCIISLLYVTVDGSSAGLSVVGKEGLAGVAVLMGGQSTPNRMVVQSVGCAYRMSAAHLTEEFNNHSEVRTLTLRFAQALITQMSQTAVCNRHHGIDQQLCRMLLLSLDRLETNQLNMTQELIANKLGVRREGVTEAAGKLQKLGVIRYLRGKITVLDRPLLERLCCECYEVVKRETDRLSPKNIKPGPVGRPRG